MASHGWRSSRPLNAQLREEFGAFDFYQLVRLLSRADGGGVRFRADLSAAFPACEVSRLEEAANDAAPGLEPGSAPGAGRITLSTPNYCVAGALGPLPGPYQEWLHARERDGDHAMGDFLDLFNHRINALRYELKERLAPGLETRAPERSDLAGYLACVAGLGDPVLAAEAPLPLRALLGVAGLLGERRRSVAVIERVLRLFLRTAVCIAPLRGGWQPLEAGECSRLGRTNHALGRSSVAGRRMWDQGAGIGVRIGPLDYDALCRLLPGEAGHAALAALLRFLTDRQVDCHVELVLLGATLPPSRLCPPGAEGLHGLRLGRTAWLKSRTGVRDGIKVSPFTVRAHEVRP